MDVAAFASKERTLTRGKSLTALLVVSFFNPVAWLNTVLVIGTVGATLPRTGQASFALGAIMASLTWFLALVTGARTAKRWMTNPNTWRILEWCVAVTMIALAAQVVRGLL